jgi:cation diffusion facilitator family transporter
MSDVRIAARSKLRVALISVGAAFFLTAAKAFVGLWTGSLALLSEAAHSGLDLFASLITALSVRVADRPADHTHHYGHGKVESLSALLEALLLVATCVWITWHAVTRLTGEGARPFVNAYSFAVMFLAIGIDLYRYNALMSTARKYHSQALEADALHFYSDLLSSSLVLIGLALVGLGFHFADALAALLVAVWVGILAIRLAKKNLDILIDRVPHEYVEKIRRLVLNSPGVLSLEQLRLRRSGSSLFADLRVGMDRTLTFEGTHRAARELEEKLAREISGLDAVVHTDPTVAPDEALDGGILNFIRTLGFQAHHILIHQHGEKLAVDLHLEMDGALTVRQAHDAATGLEAEISRHFPGVETVRIHIEEKGSPCPPENPALRNRPEIKEEIETICAEIVGRDRCHGITITQDGDNVSASLHCLFPGDLTVAEAHRQATRFEEELRRRLPILHRVQIHAEPMT